MNVRIFLLISMFLFAPALTKAAFVPVPVAIAAPNAPAHSAPVKHHTGFIERLKSRFTAPFDKAAKAIDESRPNGWAIAAFVCGLLGLFVAGIPLGILAIVFAVLGMKRRRNQGLAIAGLVLGIVSVVGALIFLGLRK